MKKPVIASLAIAGAVGASWTALPATTAEAAMFDLTSSVVQDGGMLPLKYGGNNPQFKGCAGENISPPLAWSNAPANTESFVILYMDPVGQPPIGVVHSLAYDIPATTTSFKEGEVSVEAPNVTGGKSTMGKSTYFGPCPRIGEKPHPYTFILFATDLAPGSLKPGMTREELAPVLKGHVLGSTSLVTRYGH